MANRKASVRFEFLIECLSGTAKVGVVKPEAEFERGTDDFPPEKAPTFNVVVAYDAPRTARRALDLVAGVTRDMGEEVSIHRNLWRFDVLSFPSERQTAVNDAARADLVVVAANGDEELPASVKVWLEAWTARRGAGESALVALLESYRPAREHSSPARSVLEAAARKAGQEFFVHEFRAPSPKVDTSIEDIRQRAAKSSSVLLGILERSQPPSRSAS